MKKIITTEVTDQAKLPGITKVIDHSQESYTEIVDAIVKGLISYTAGDIIILHGCVISGADPGARDVTAGAIYYNGEIYLVSAASFNTTGSNIPVWVIAETFPSGSTTFSDNSNHNVFSVRKFVLQSGPIGGSGVSGYVADYNSSTVKNISGTWISATINGAYTGSVYYRKIGKAVYLRGAISISSGNFIAISSFTLPVGFRPIAALASPVIYTALGVVKSDTILIATDGTVRGNSVAGVDTMAFDGVCFLAD